MKKWERVGVVGVDAGLCWIGDPGYVVTPDADEHPAKTWNEFVTDLQNNQSYLQTGVRQYNYKMGHPGLGVCIGGFGGDGTFNVFVRRDDDGRIAEAKVVFG